jgi:hypothetical protein
MFGASRAARRGVDDIEEFTMAGAQSISRSSLLLLTLLLFACSGPQTSRATDAAPTVSAAAARVIARDAYIYGYPLVDSYRILYSYFVDRGNPEYKAAWNEKVYNNARVFTPDDTAMQTPNSDTPYSQLGLDLRAEPMVLSVPAVEKGRYYSVEVSDLYTFIAGYIGSRTTGNDRGDFLVAGPRWKGETPRGIKGVIRSETDLAFVFYRTQLFGPSDIDNVKKVPLQTA